MPLHYGRNHDQSPFVIDLDNFPFQAIDMNKNCIGSCRAKKMKEAYVREEGSMEIAFDFDHGR
jgi:hypothetical protein